MIVRSSASRLDKTVRPYSTIIIFPITCLFPASEARAISKAFPNVHLGLVRTACSFRCTLSNSRSSLVMLVLGRDIVHDHSTACARDAYCKPFSP